MRYLAGPRGCTTRKCFPSGHDRRPTTSEHSAKRYPSCDHGERPGDARRFRDHVENHTERDASVDQGELRHERRGSELGPG